jgi:hypothetical protein
MTEKTWALYTCPMCSAKIWIGIWIRITIFPTSFSPNTC